MCMLTYSCVPWLILIVPWRIHMCAMANLYVCHDAIICVPWRIYMCAMAHSYVRHDFFWMRHDSSSVCRNSFICVLWRIRMWTMTHCSGGDGGRCLSLSSIALKKEWVVSLWHGNVMTSPVRHDSFIYVTHSCVTWLIHVRDMTHSYVCHGSVTWMIYICVTLTRGHCDMATSWAALFVATCCIVL